MMRALRAGGLDGVVVELDAGGGGGAAPRGTTAVPLLDEPWRLVVPTGSLLVSDVVDLSRLTLPWLGIDPTAASAQALRRVRALLGHGPETRHTYYSLQNALALVAAGEGVTLVPSLALEGLRTEGVDALEVPGLGMRRIVLRVLTRAHGASGALDTATGLIREAAASFDFEPPSQPG